MTMDKHTLALGAALGATGVEVFCVYDGLREATGAQLAAGVAIAILAPLVPAYIEGARRYFATIVFVFALACVIVASGSRVGGALDRVEGAREQAARATKLAEESKRELAAMLTEARTAATTACAKRTKACLEAEKRVDTLQGKLTAARTTLAAAPIEAGEGDVARVAAWLGGFLTEHQVRLYLPLLWPVTMALVGAFFWGVWGDGRPKLSPTPTPAKPEAIKAPEAKPNVLGVLADVVAPADRRKRLEIADVFAAYAAACKARGAEVASADVFGTQAKAFTDAAGIRVLASGGKLFWCGVKLCGSA
jgi:hypothetical protein